MKDSTEKSSNQIVSDFLSNNKKVLITVLGVITLVLVLLGIYTMVSKSNTDKAFNATIELDNLYEELLSENIEAEQFIEYADSLVVEYKGSKAELMAYSRLASYYFDESLFDKAVKNYTAAYLNFPNDMAASVYMFNAAMALEELGQVDEAIKTLELLVATFKSSDLDVNDTSADVPEALFNLGRLAEGSGDTTTAISYYEQLVAEYKDYNITNLAKSRLLSFK